MCEHAAPAYYQYCLAILVDCSRATPVPVPVLVPVPVPVAPRHRIGTGTGTGVNCLHALLDLRWAGVSGDACPCRGTALGPDRLTLRAVRMWRSA